MATITFYGAAQEVTGSCHLLQSSALGRVLLDCGMHQGGNANEREKKDEFQFDPSSIDAVILSHGHLDHSGQLPKLVHQGFRGPIYCTRATKELLSIMLFDSVGIYERDLERDNLRRERRDLPPLEPEYDRGDVEQVLEQCSGHAYGKSFNISEKASVTFFDAGHILGSAIVKIKLQEKGSEKQLVFSGDLGKKDAVLMNEPTIVKYADVVMMEGTYGDRNHRTLESTIEQLKEILSETWERGGNVLIPSFAVERTQELIFHLGCLHKQGELDNWEVFLDSPMAIAVTKLYDRWLNLLDDEDVRALSDSHRSTLESFLPRLNLSVTPEDSMAINKVKKGAIIIAGSGMCTGGRMRHHIKQRIWNSRNTMMFVGFQAYGTLGRILVDGVKRIKLFNEEFAVKARIETLGGFSAHADQRELLDWISHFDNGPKVILVHGEPKSLDALSEKLWEEKGVDAQIPCYRESIAF